MKSRPSHAAAQLDAELAPVGTAGRPCPNGNSGEVKGQVESDTQCAEPINLRIENLVNEMLAGVDRNSVFAPKPLDNLKLYVAKVVCYEDAFLLQFADNVNAKEAIEQPLRPIGRGFRVEDQDTFAERNAAPRNP